MTYHEAMVATVTVNQAKTEIENHGCSFEQFIAENGLRRRYTGKSILVWLGY